MRISEKLQARHADGHQNAKLVVIPEAAHNCAASEADAEASNTADVA